MTFVNEGDFISFRHHVFVKTSHKEVQLAEVGPRFEMRREPGYFSSNRRVCGYLLGRWTFCTLERGRGL